MPFNDVFRIPAEYTARVAPSDWTAEQAREPLRWDKSAYHVDFDFQARLRKRLDEVLPPVMQEIARRQQASTQPEESSMQVQVNYAIQPFQIPTRVTVETGASGRVGGQAADGTEAGLHQTLSVHLVDAVTLNRLAIQWLNGLFDAANKPRDQSVLACYQREVDSLRREGERYSEELLQTLRKLEKLRDVEEKLDFHMDRARDLENDLVKLQQEHMAMLADRKVYRAAVKKATVAPPRRKKANGKAARA